MEAIRTMPIFGVVLALCACGPSPEASELNTLTANQGQSNDGVQNRAIVVLGDSDGIPGTMRDFERMPRVLEGLGFQVTPMRYPSPGELLAKIREVTGDMSAADRQAFANQQPGGSFAFYVTSHGTPDGSTSLSGQFFNMRQVAQAITSARGGLPLERFIPMFDTCFSESNRDAIEGANDRGFAITDNPMTDNPMTNNGRRADGRLNATALASVARQHVERMSQFKGLYYSSFSWFSSRRNQTSLDAGDGGVATKAFINALGSATAGNFKKGQDHLGIYNQRNEAWEDANRSDFRSESTANATTNNTSPEEAMAILGVRHANINEVRLGDIANQMTGNTPGQNPVICFDPPPISEASIGDEVQGVLPPNVRNSQGSGGERRQCSGAQ